MVTTERMRYILALIGLLILLLPAVALAQSPAEVFINYPEISEGPRALSLGLYFTVLDPNGQIIPEPKIQSATIELGDGTTYEASFEQPTSQAYVVLVLDASGSMGSAMPQMRQAAVQAVENAPDEAVFAVIQFNNTITLLQDFTQDRRKVAEQIEAIRSVPGAGTCLYDATHRAIQLLEAAPLGRRGVVLFTDGRDETAQGTPCSQHTYNEVIAYATRQTARVPIHTIGLAGEGNPINVEELRTMASITGGFSEVGELNSLSLLFQRIINGMAYQWLARADVYPKAGENTAQLVLRFEDGSELRSDPLSFTASHDYIAPPSATVESLTYTNTGNVVFNLRLTNADQIDRFQLQVVDVRNNVMAPPFYADVTETLEVAATNFEQGTEYQIVIIGEDAAQQRLFQTTYEFRYNPNIAEGQLKIMAVQLDADARQFVVEVKAANIVGISHYEVWLNDQETNTVVPGSRFTIQPQNQIVVPLEGIPNGTYKIVVTAVGVDGQVLAEAAYDNAVYRVGLFKRLGGSVRGSPLIIALMVVVILAASAFLFKVAYLDPKKERERQKGGVLLENTIVRRAADLGALDDWSEDAQRLQRRRLREEGAPTREPQARGRRPAQSPSQRQMPPPSSAIPGQRHTPPPRAAVPPAATPAPAGPMPQARLTVERSPDGTYDGAQYLIASVPFTIGRADSDVNLKFPSVSRHHAQILFEGGQFVIRDEGSTNGTTVDGRIITGMGSAPLRSGAQIGIGKNVILRFDVL